MCTYIKVVITIKLNEIRLFGTLRDKKYKQKPSK